MAVITLVVGTRPNYMKMWPIWKALTESEVADGHKIRVVSTGQHSESMRQHVPLPHDAVFEARGVGEERLQVMVEVLTADFESSHTDIVVVAGDVDSTLAGAIAAVETGSILIHYEAGLRSGDWRMPEERNRVLVGQMADYHFCTTLLAMGNCAGSGKAVVVGNSMLDTLQELLPRSVDSSLLGDLGLRPGKYALMTIHRPTLVDDNAKLKDFYDNLKAFAKRHPVVWPVHPRVPWCPDRYKGLYVVPAVTYVDFLALEANAGVVITDSGGVQEEASYLGVPCIVHRTTTERRECLAPHGSVFLAGTNPAVTFNMADSQFGGDFQPKWDDERYADGRAGKRAAGFIYAIARGEEL